MRPLRRAALCVLSGTLWFLACANFDIWPLAWLAMVPTLVVVLEQDCARPLHWAWLTGLVANGGGFYWINLLLMRFGHLPLIAAAPIYFLLIGYQAITYALFGWAVRRLHDALGLPMVVLAPIAFTACEYVVPYLFPWYVSITQAWVRPVIQIADLTGPLGVSFLLLLCNGALYDLYAAFRRRAPLPWRGAAIAAAVIAAALVYGQVRIHQVEARRAVAPKVKIGLVQANIGIHEKFVPGLGEMQLALHQRLSADLVARGAELIVWPESSYPYAISRQRTSDFPESDRRKVQRGFQAPILFGALTRDEGGDGDPYNTALMMDGDGRITGRFDKNFLLVFGEYIPFYRRIPWFRDYIPEASNFARGETVTSFPFRQFRLGPMICYEDILPSFGQRLVATRPNVFINITNDAWFGATSEPWEHMALAVYRAVEHRVDLVRAVNTGVSAFIDATGRVQDHGPAVDPGANPGVQPVTLLGEVAMLEPGGLFATVGESFGLACLAALLGLAAWARRRVGQPIVLRTVAAGVGLLTLLLALALTIAAGRSRFGVALDVLLHRPALPGDSDAAFAIVGRLLPLGGLAIVTMAALLSRLERARRPVELATAAVLTLLVPALVAGRIEGETASLVFTALGAVALTRLGVRLGAGAAASPTEPLAAAAPPPSDPPPSAAPPPRTARRKRR